MTYIVTVVVLEPTLASNEFVRGLHLDKVVAEPAHEGPHGECYACYLPDLWRCIGLTYNAFGIHIMIDNGSGYLTSLPFIQFPDEVDDLTDVDLPRVWFSSDVKPDVAMILNAAVEASLIRQALFFFEPTLFTTEDDLEYKYEGTPVNSAMSVDEFWATHDNSRLWAGVIYPLHGPT